VANIICSYKTYPCKQKGNYRLGSQSKKIDAIKITGVYFL